MREIDPSADDHASQSVAEYYIYDVIFRNRALFRKPHTANRVHYGYRFENGASIAPTVAYKDFKGALAAHGKSYSHHISFDIASYFNSVYHPSSLTVRLRWKSDFAA